MGEALRESGQEYGASTGRPRRCGWYDSVAMKYAVRLNGIEALALTKLDVLDELDEIHLCTEYRYGGKIFREWSFDSADLTKFEPTYEKLPGWSKPTRGAQNYNELPKEAKNYVSRLEEVTGVPVVIISTGSDRAETIIRDGTLLDSWL
jgi:adenylosuccinate synthase